MSRRGIFSAAGLMFLLMVAVAGRAESVYNFDSGRWHLKGYADETSCVLYTDWSDGKRIQVNVFPKIDGSANVTMTVLNPEWHGLTAFQDKPFNVGFIFMSSQYGDRSFKGTAQVYSDQKIIFRGLNRNFARAFIHWDSLVLFRGTVNQLVIHLDGTADIASHMAQCRNLVLGTDQGENF